MTSAGHDDLADTRAFFAPRAATWDERFPDDDDKFAAAVGRLALRVGSTAIDVGCGTGWALPHLRRGRRGHRSRASASTSPPRWRLEHRHGVRW